MSEIAQQLKKTNLFADVALEDLQALSKVMEPLTFSPGVVVFNLGDRGDAMYIIQSGRIRIFIFDNEGQELTLMHYGENEVFGEFSLLDDKPRSASAAAAEMLTVFMLRRDDFLNFLSNRPLVSIAMMRSLAQRARYTTSYVEEVVHWAKSLAKGEYNLVIEEITKSEDRTEIKGLIAAFLQMTKSVQEREEELKQQVIRLQIQIDQKKRQTDVQSITRSDFFANLKQQAKQMRDETAFPQKEDEN